MKKEYLSTALFVFLAISIVTLGLVVGYKGARQKVEMRAEKEIEEEAGRETGKIVELKEEADGLAELINEYQTTETEDRSSLDRKIEIEAKKIKEKVWEILEEEKDGPKKFI